MLCQDMRQKLGNHRQTLEYNVLHIDITVNQPFDSSSELLILQLDVINTPSRRDKLK